MRPNPVGERFGDDGNGLKHRPYGKEEGHPQNRYLSLVNPAGSARVRSGGAAGDARALVEVTCHHRNRRRGMRGCVCSCPFVLKWRREWL